jgi:hypothetical protein
MEDQEQVLELERRRLAELQLARKHPASQPYFGYSDGFKVSHGMLFIHLFASLPCIWIFIIFLFFFLIFLPNGGVSCSHLKSKFLQILSISHRQNDSIICWMF